MTAIKKRTARGLSEYEEVFAMQLRAVGLGDYEREYMFHPLRKWRFDFCFPDKMVALEVEGGIYSRGRHVTPAGFIEDCLKYDEAALLGWKVLRLPMTWIDTGQALHYAELALRGKSDWTPMQY